MAKEKVLTKKLLGKLEDKLNQYEKLSEEIELLGSAYLLQRVPGVELSASSKYCPNCQRRFTGRVRGLLRHVLICDKKLQELLDD